MEQGMDASGPDATEAHGILLAMQKNLECPICLEIMKTPVSTHCAHVFCSFCILKLLGQKKGTTRCPVCNDNISKSSLQEEVRLKLVIKAVLEALGALEHDTGINFLGDQCLHKKTAVLEEKQMVVESKGYRGRLSGVEKAEKRSRALQSKSSSLPLTNTTVTKRSLIKKSISKKTVFFEIGSDSSEDLFQKTSTVRCVGRRNNSQDGEKRSQSPCHVEFQEPNGEEVVLPGTPEACGLSEAGRDGTEGNRASPGNGDAVKENAAVEKRQDLSSPVPGIRRRRGQPVSSSAPEDSSCPSPSMESSQPVAEATDLAPNKQAGNKAEMVSMVQPAGSAHISDCLCEDEQELQQPQASPQSPLSQGAGKRLDQSIQKVNEWFSKSKILSPAPSQEVNAEERDPYLLDGVFQETELMAAAGCEVGRPASKPVVSRMVDKIFGRTYVKTRKSSRIRIPAEECCTAVNTKSCDTPVRKIPAQKNVTLELAPEDVLKKRTAMEDSEGARGSANAVLEEDGPGLAVVDGFPGAVQRPAELPVKEGASGFELGASPIGFLSNLQNCKKNSLSRRSLRRGKPVCPLQLAVQGGSWTLEKAQAGGNPSREGPQEGSSDQTPVRRSKRLLLRAEGEQWESEPARKRRKQLAEGEKEQKETQAGNASPSAAGGGPSALQGTAGDARQACAFPEEEDSLRVEHPTERYSHGHTVPDATSQSSCSLLQRHLAEGEQSDHNVKEFAAVPQSEQSAMCSLAPEGRGFCLRVVKESCKSPKACDAGLGNGELNPEADDSELDAGFMWKVFHRCKRQSFLLHPAPSKKPAAGTQTEPSIGQAEGREVDCAEKSTSGIASISKVRREAVSCSESEHLQIASQVVFPNSLCLPGTVKEAKSGNLLSPKLASNKKESSEVEKTSNSNNCSCGNAGLGRRGDFQGTSSHPADEMSSKTTQFLEARPESDRNKALGCTFCSERIQPPSAACQPGSSKSRSGSVEDKSGVGEPKQLKGTWEQTVQVSSIGASGGHLEQSPKDETPGFTLLSDTPEGLLGSATNGLLNPWEGDQQEALAMPARTDLEKDLECSSSSSGSMPKSLAKAQQRRMQKLPSSGEEDSSEDEELPCFQAQIFGRLASTPSQPTKGEEASAEIPTQRSSSSKFRAEDGSPSQGSEGSVNLFSSQSHASEGSTSKPCDTRLLAPVPTSQGKAMKAGTAMEPLGKISRDAGQLQAGHQDGINAEANLGEALGYDSEVSHLGDSSGFSSQNEILTTQQKDAMQNNLEKLRQEMAVLQAALKEGGQDATAEGLRLPGEESIFAEGQMSSTSDGVALVLKTSFENQRTSHWDFSSSDKLPPTPESPVNTKSPEPVLQQGHAPGSTSQLRGGSRQSLLSASPPAGSPCRTPDGGSASSSASREDISCYLAPEPEKGSPVAIPDIPSAQEHKSRGRPVSSFAATTTCRDRKGNSRSLLPTDQKSMSLVASGLFPDELRLVQKFARKTKSIWSNTISEGTTHVIMKTDEDLVCERTLKYFLGIAARKWVVSYQWVLQSLDEGSVLNEADFEVRGDIINGRNHQGPKRARESPTGKIFQGLEICCYGPFTDMQREQLEWMVELCGASLVKQPHLFSCSTNSAEALVVIQPDAWEEDSGCPGIPLHCSATVVAREWVLDSVACYQRMALDGYIMQQA